MRMMRKKRTRERTSISTSCHCTSPMLTLWEQKKTKKRIKKMEDILNILMERAAIPPEVLAEIEASTQDGNNQQEQARDGEEEEGN